ncbi:MAG: hypothetical protein LQ348_000345 [Seirophora lacunosa]|nr:MAG: hypothetical protein LQ348_000345 [Seirophora lacunosa]
MIKVQRSTEIIRWSTKRTNAREPPHSCLLQEIQFAADKHPIKITCAALGRGSVHGRWPERSENKELRGKVKEEVFEVIGLRLGGMQFMRWIWGEDDRQTFNNTGVYASAYLEPAEEAKAEESKAEEPK